MKMFGNHWNIRNYQVIPMETVFHEESDHMIDVAYKQMSAAWPHQEVYIYKY